jgi:hypothetical protein
MPCSPTFLMCAWHSLGSKAKQVLEEWRVGINGGVDLRRGLKYRLQPEATDKVAYACSQYFKRVCLLELLSKGRYGLPLPGS